MQLIVLTGLPTKEKGWLARDLAEHYLAGGKRVAILDNENIAEDLGNMTDRVELVTMRGGCACCAVAGKLYSSAAKLSASTDVAIMAANHQTHIDNLGAVLDNLVAGNSTPISVKTVALVDERTTCCFPYVAERLEDNADVMLSAPFTAEALIAALG